MGTFVSIVFVTAFNLLYGWFCYRLGARRYNNMKRQCNIYKQNRDIFVRRCDAAQERIAVLEREIRDAKQM